MWAGKGWRRKEKEVPVRQWWIYQRPVWPFIPIRHFSRRWESITKLVDLTDSILAFLQIKRVAFFQKPFFDWLFDGMKFKCISIQLFKNIVDGNRSDLFSLTGQPSRITFWNVVFLVVLLFCSGLVFLSFCLCVSMCVCWMKPLWDRVVSFVVSSWKRGE